MANQLVKLSFRGIISISGEDKFTFLQGLITNDINKAKEGRAIYSLMLTPQGKFLYDFFIILQESKLFLDVSLAFQEQIIKKLNMYKLRSDVEVKKEAYHIYASFDKNIDGGVSFKDPRSENMGYRIYSKKELDAGLKENFYHLKRVENIVVEPEFDMESEASFPLQFNMNELNAIDYKKGCYVGQEVTARSHYRGKQKKQVILLEGDFNKGDKIKEGRVLSVLNGKALVLSG